MDLENKITGDQQYIGDFHGATIDYRAEYLECRKTMTTKGTDLNNLRSVVAHLLLNCPECLVTAYQSLIFEIGDRQRYLEFPILFNYKAEG